jgi:TPP-dependent pyruvate/acetoin dehydrogenase alpha subunit
MPELLPDRLAEFYRRMVTIRAFEDQVRQFHRAGLAPGLVHLYSGQEAVAVGACGALQPADVIASHHRGHGHCIAKGGKLDQLFAEILGRASEYGQGRGGSMHIFDPANGNLGTNGIVGGGVPLATGAALSAKLKGESSIAVCFFGDGVLNQGILFEAMNMAALWALPVVYICENNGYGEFTDIDDVTAGRPYTGRGEAFGIPSQQVDGMDVREVHAAVSAAAEKARSGGGPTFLICDTYRYSGHHVGDAEEYKDDGSRQMWLQRDPIPKLAETLRADAIAAISAEVEAEVRGAAERAKAIPMPSAASAEASVYAE